MDSTRFDSLTRSLHDVRSRRAALATLLSGALAIIGGTAVAGAKGTVRGDGTVKTQGSGGQKSKWRCRRLGTICFRKPKKGSASEKRDCKFCCSGSFRQLSTSKGRCCNHEGLPCATNEQCCSGVCANGACQVDLVDGVGPGPGTPACVPSYAGACKQTTDCCDVNIGIRCLGNNPGTCRFS